MRGDEVEAATDVRSLYANDGNILAYRIGILETDIQGIDRKLDNFISLYPSKDMLDLILNPMRDSIKELEAQVRREKEEKVKNTQQVKYLTYAAIVGPLGTFLVTIILASLFGVFPK